MRFHTTPQAVIGEWQFFAGFSRAPEAYSSYDLRIGYIKIKKKPLPGYEMQRNKEYVGNAFTVRFIFGQRALLSLGYSTGTRIVLFSIIPRIWIRANT